MDPQDYIDLKGLEGKIDRQKVLIGVAVVVALILLFSPISFWYQVEANSEGVVLRLGRYDRKTGPGLHFMLPFVEKVFVVPTQEQLKEEFGFRTLRAGIRTEYSSRQYLDESLMLTGDLNVAIVEWTVQYRIQDPYQYLFRVRNVPYTFRAMSEAVMREVIGDRTVNEVLTVGRTEVALSAQQKLQELFAQQMQGIQFIRV